MNDDTRDAHARDVNPVTAGLLVCMLAVLLAWTLSLAGLTYFHPNPWFEISDEVAVISVNSNATAEERAELANADRVRHKNDSLFALGMVGLLAGASFGAIEGIARRDFRRAVVFGSTGILLGTAFGCVAGWSGVAIYEAWKSVAKIPSMVQATLLQTVVLAILGGGLGLAFGVSTVRGRTAVRSAVVGLLAGGLAGTVYVFAIANLLPNARTQDVVPTEFALRAIWLGCLLGVVGMIVPAISRHQRSASEERTSSPDDSEEEGD